MKRRYLSNRITRFAAEMALCLTLLLICGNTAAAAEDETIRSEYSYRRYTTADGLHSMRNKYILQDGKGFIWIAGRTGLSRYDGFEFKSWLKDKDANIFKLDKDEGGRIRAFSDNLIYSVDEQADTLVCTVISQSRYEISAYSSRDLPDGYGIFGKNKSQALYAISDTGLVMIVEHERLTDFQYTNTTFYDTEKNQLYLPCEDTVHVINGHTLVASYPMTAGSFCLYGDAVLALAEDGIYTLKEGRAECIFRHEISILETPSKIYADTNGDIFFCAKTGLFRLRENRIDTLLTAVTLADFLIDREHNLWAVTYEGLFNLFRLEFSNYVFSLADSEDVFRTVVYQEESDAVIAGTLNGRVYEIRDAGARIRRLSFPQSRYNVSFFLDYSTATPDAVYLPGPGDVLKLGRNLKQWIGLPYHPQCRFVVRLPDGNLIAGGAQQLFLFTPDGKLLKEFGQSSVKQEVYAKPCTDRQGRLWLGGRSGVTIYDLAADSVHVTLFNDGMRMCNHMDTDRKGNVWFTSENRLFIATDDTVQLKHTFDRMIAGLYFTRREDRLIVSTLGGIHIFDENMEDHVFYNHENGYTGIEVFSGAMAEDALGNIWLPSLSGLVCFNPARLMRRQPKPDMLLLSTASSTDNIHWLYVGISNLKLNHQRRNIRFDYIGLSYTSAQNIRYRYRLLGFQDEWSEPVKQREVTFNNLPPGDYTFEIYADAGTDESRSETQSLAFTIRPAFWQTAWFLAACIIFLILSGAGVALFVQRRKNRALLEKLRAEKELNELRISSIRLKAIPHFNANVLAAIEYYIANRTKKDAMRILAIYSDFTLKTLTDVDRAARPLSEELAYVKMYLDLEKVRFMEKFDFRISVDDGVDESVQLPNMILHTWCENAVKHGLMPLKSGGLLAIRVTRNDRSVCVHVEDNGVGRARANRNPHVHSTKQGLAILNRQIEIYNRFNRVKIVVRVDDLTDGDIPAGTRFTAEIPSDFEYVC